MTGSDGPRPYVLYITSLPHSGSTLLDMMLGAHSQITSLGEVGKLANYVRPDKLAKHAKRGKRQPCTCGATPLRACPMWARVEAQLETLSGKTLADLNLLHGPSAPADNAYLFQAVARTTGCSVLVDSTKQRKRLRCLWQSPGITVVPVYIHRRPEGQIRSMTRKYGRFWKKLGQNVRQTFRRTGQVKQSRYLATTYERLVQDPEGELAQLLAPLELGVESGQLAFGAVERHNIGGNRTRFSTSSLLQIDDRWRFEMPPWQKAAVAALAWPGDRRAKATVRRATVDHVTRH